MQRTILAALRSCHALAGLLHDHFKESNWCDQEVGIVFGRGAPVIPVRVDLDPYGFFGVVQAVAGKDKPIPEIARGIVDVLANDKRTSGHIVEVMVRTLEQAQSFNQANLVAARLEAHASRVTDDQLRRIKTAQKDNYEVANAFDVPSAVYALERSRR